MKSIVRLNKEDGLAQLRDLLDVEVSLLAGHQSAKKNYKTNGPWWRKILFGNDRIINSETVLRQIRISRSELRIEHLRRQIIRLECSESGTIEFMEKD